MSDTYENIYEYLADAVGDDRCLGDGTEAVGKSILAAVTYIVSTEDKQSPKMVFGYPAPTVLYIVSKSHKKAQKSFHSFAAFILDHVPSTYRHRVDLDDSGWSSTRLTATVKGVIVRFVPESEMILAASLLDRTNTYYMISEEETNNKPSPPPPKVQKPMKMPKPIYLGERPTTMDAIKKAIATIILAVALSIIIFQFHGFIIHIKMHGW